MGIPDKTTIEFFDGPHEVHGVGIFEFLRRHLLWPAPPAASGSGTSVTPDNSGTEFGA